MVQTLSAVSHLLNLLFHLLLNAYHIMTVQRCHLCNFCFPCKIQQHKFKTVCAIGNNYICMH